MGNTAKPVLEPPIEPETCPACVDARDYHLIGLGCVKIVGWEPSEVHPISEAVPFEGQGLLDFTAPPKAVRLSPIFCSCWRGEMTLRKKRGD
jgi:hypothetical protein